VRLRWCGVIQTASGPFAARARAGGVGRRASLIGGSQW